jgi:hypothetical protein
MLFDEGHVAAIQVTGVQSIYVDLLAEMGIRHKNKFKRIKKERGESG